MPGKEIELKNVVGSNNKSFSSTKKLFIDLSINNNNNQPPAKKMTGTMDYNDIVFGEKLNYGSFGVIYKATWKQQDIALKVIDYKYHSSYSECEDERYMLETITKLQKDKYHYAVRLHGYLCNHEQKLYYLAEEYAAQGSLYDLLHSNRYIGLLEIYPIASDVISAIAWLHRHNIIHRDIKSDNVVLRNNRAMLCDFGAATFLDVEDNLTDFVGTPAWMAPEVIFGQVQTEKVDIYSFGMLLWEMNTRQSPYSGSNKHEVMVKRCNGEKEVIPNNLYSDMANRISRCWENEPTSRPSAKSLRKEILKEEKDFLMARRMILK